MTLGNREIKNKIEKIIEYIKANSGVSLDKLWKPILTIGIVKKKRPEFKFEGENIIDELIYICDELENEEERFRGFLFRDFKEFGHGASKIIFDFSKVLDELKESETDFLGTLYDWLLIKFGGSMAETFGSYYTPKALGKMLVGVLDIDVDKDKNKRILDIACGSGGLLLAVKKDLEKKGKWKDKEFIKNIKFYGQELNEDAAKLANANLAINNMEGKVACCNSCYEDKVPELIKEVEGEREEKKSKEEEKTFLWDTPEEKEFMGKIWIEYYEYLNTPKEKRKPFPVDKLHYLVCDSLRIERLYNSWKEKNQIS